MFRGLFSVLVGLACLGVLHIFTNPGSLIIVTGIVMVTCMCDYIAEFIKITKGGE